MKFKEVSTDVVKRGYYMGNLRGLIDEFLKTGYTVAEIDISSYKNPNSAVGVINTAIKRQARQSQVKAIKRKDKAYLVNLIKYEKEAE